MSAIKNILKLLLILEDDNRVFTNQELADQLGVTTRQVRNYITELREFGYVIHSSALKGGGYRSVGQTVQLPLRVTNEELMALSQVINFVEKNGISGNPVELKSLQIKMKRGD